MVSPLFGAILHAKSQENYALARIAWMKAKSKLSFGDYGETLGQFGTSIPHRSLNLPHSEARRIQPLIAFFERCSASEAAGFRVAGGLSGARRRREEDGALFAGAGSGAPVLPQRPTMDDFLGEKIEGRFF